MANDRGKIDLATTHLVRGFIAFAIFLATLQLQDIRAYIAESRAERIVTMQAIASNEKEIGLLKQRVETLQREIGEIRQRYLSSAVK